MNSLTVFIYNTRIKTQYKKAEGYECVTLCPYQKMKDIVEEKHPRHHYYHVLYSNNVIAKLSRNKLVCR